MLIAQTGGARALTDTVWHCCVSASQAHREINIARKLADTEQEQLRCRQSEALSGDVHEFSNYLVSMWALAEEKNKRKGSRKTPM